MAKDRVEQQRRSKYRRARIRSFLFTVGPDRLSRGRIAQRHLSQDVVVRPIELASPLWPAEFDGLRIGHVSDFHIGQLLPLDKAISILELLGAQEPDLVACTGDVIDLRHDGSKPFFDAMGALDAPLGSMFVLGNHDELHCADTVADLARDAGVHVLRDEAVRICRGEGELVVAGIDWAKSPVQCAQHVDRVYGEPTHLLLAHNPKAFQRASELDIALTLSGHTHGGQIAVKKRPNANLALTHRHSAGLFQRGASQLYVTVGVGAWFPLRVNCPAEIAMITMRHRPATPEAETEAAEATPKRRRRSKLDDGR